MSHADVLCGQFLKTNVYFCVQGLENYFVTHLHLHHTVRCMSLETCWRRPRGHRSLKLAANSRSPVRVQVETCAQLGGFCQTRFLFNVTEDGKLPNTTRIAEGAICVSLLCTDHVFYFLTGQYHSVIVGL